MEFSDADMVFRARFLEPKFEPESFVQSIGKSHESLSIILSIDS